MDIKVGQLVVFNKSADAAPFRVEKILDDGFNIFVVDAHIIRGALQAQDKSCALPYKGPVSWAPEVITDDTGRWYGNSLRFATEAEALDNVRDLEMRWMAVRATRAAQSVDPVTHRWVGGKLEEVELTIPQFRKQVRTRWPHVRVTVHAASFADLARGEAKALTISNASAAEAEEINQLAKRANILPDGSIRIVEEDEAPEERA